VLTVLKFMAIALAFSWSMWILYAASMAGRLPFQVPAELALLGEYGPTFAAFFLLALERSGGGVRDLLQRMVKWRVQPKWYVFVVLAIPLIMLTTIALTVAMGGTPPELMQLAEWPEHFRTRTSVLSPSMGLLSGLSTFMSKGTWATMLGMILLGVCQGGLSEEPGWRGFALPRAQARFNLLTAALIVGAQWAVWHTGPEQWLLLFKSGFVSFIQTVPLNVLQYLFLTLPLAVL
jgi:membrane protease YdiL (CAAX protease family)